MSPRASTISATRWKTDRVMTRFRPLIVVLAVIWAVEVVNLALGHGLANWGLFGR